jgi:hypothetical protein
MYMATKSPNFDRYGRKLKGDKGLYDFSADLDWAFLIVSDPDTAPFSALN